MKKHLRLSPFLYPILYFGVVILTGTFLLQAPFTHPGKVLGWVDALFTATSATCVTGLVVVDTGSFFNHWGQAILLVLIQCGGLGIMTFTGLFFYLLHRRVSVTDRVAVGQSLLHDPTFSLGKFLGAIVVLAFGAEAVGAVALHLAAPSSFTPFSALFHAVSAFCNAGFSLFPDSLSTWRGSWFINLVFMGLIVAGGLGFSVLMELLARFWAALNGKSRRLSWYSLIVLKTTVFLIVAGWVAIFLAEFCGNRCLPAGQQALAALFQSVTCRTAGFNTLDIGRMTNVSLMIMIVLMFIGAAPGSCAGGIKVTTFRAVAAFIWAQARASHQAVIGRFALDRKTINKAIVLTATAALIIIAGVLLLNITEGGDVPHPRARGMFLEIFFEVVSAFGTVGLSTGITASLSAAGKLILTVIMFVGRLGPILFFSVLQSFKRERFFNLAEESLLIG